MGPYSTVRGRTDPPSDTEGKRRLGEILLAHKSITRRQLARALRLQERHGGYLGQHLIHIGAITEAELAAALAGQLDLPSGPHADHCAHPTRAGAVLRRVGGWLGGLWRRTTAITLISPPSESLAGSFRQFRLAVYILLIVLIGGTVGYHQIEGWTPLESVYMTVISLTTVGYGETRPLSPNGRVFTMFVVVFGAGAGLWALTTLIGLLVSRELDTMLREGHMAKEISKLKEHYIICGYGRLGRHVAVEMGHFGAQYVVIERQPETVAKAKGDGHLTLVGDATDGQTLRAAGIDRAKGLVAATVGDAENTFITLTARKMNPDVYIVACASNDDAEDKMKTAGADEVVSAYLMGGKMLSSALLNPGIDCLINAILTGAAWQPVKILEVEPDSDAAHEGMTVGEARARTQALILAVGHSADEFGVNPSDDAVLSGGNSVAALGTVEQLSLLRNLLEAA